MNSAWFKLYIYHVTGSGPPSLLLVKGTRLRRLPRVFYVSVSPSGSLQRFIFYVSLGLLYGYVFTTLYFDFLITSQEVGWNEHLQYDLFNVKWDVKA